MVFILWDLFEFLCHVGVPVRAINRPGSQLLGANGRDDGPIVSFLLIMVEPLKFCCGLNYCYSSLATKIILSRHSITWVLCVFFSSSDHAIYKGWNKQDFLNGV